MHHFPAPTKTLVASLAGFSDTGLKPICNDVQAGFSFLQTRLCGDAVLPELHSQQLLGSNQVGHSIHDRLASS